MVFSSISFLYYFLPIILCIYFAVPYKFKNTVLLIGSLFFYFWGEPRFAVLLLLSTAIDYSLSLIIDSRRGTKTAKRALIASVVINIGILGFFKYSDFIIANINAVFNTNLPLLGISLPIGISFFTFQTMSYTIDVYRNEAKVQKNPLNLATYISLFPQLIAGPIVRYQTVAEEINERTHSFENFAYGIRRFVIGLSKKVLIANALGELNVIATSSNEVSVLFYWIGAISFALQIYFDFSGYSDMAIGLGRIFGFHFLENFNYPYISKSISEFWRRWHISLGTWFREYVYIPLGGNRVPKWKWFRNIFAVWMLTGLWHGASWNFVIWGLYFGIIIMLERLFLEKALDKLPSVLRYIYVCFIVVISFVIFNVESIPEIIMYLKGMFGMLDIPLTNQESLYYLRSYSTVMIMAIIGATPLVKNIVSKGYENRILKKLYVLEPAVYIVLLVIVTGYIVDSSFNPFLYFRF